MTDVLKVFVNTSNQTVTPSLSAVTLNLMATTAGQTAVVKDLDFVWVEASPYKRNIKLLLDGYTLSQFSDSGGFSAAGSQIMNESSTLSLQVELEEPLQTFRKVKGFFERASDMLLIDYTYDTTIDALANFTAMYGSGTAQAKKTHTSTSKSTCSYFRNGEPFFVTSSGSSQFYVMDATQSQVYGGAWGVSCNAIASDENYVYGVNNAAEQYLRIFNHQTLALEPAIFLSTSITGTDTTNPGFIAAYGGKLYLKSQGNDSFFQIVNTTTGAVTTVSDNAMNESSTKGAAVTVTKEGKAYLVVAMQDNAMLYDIEADSLTFAPLAFSNGTTTYSNQVINIGEGLVLVNNTSYGTVMIIDVSSGVMVQTLVTSFADLDTNVLSLMSMAGLTADRELSYGALISGVETT
jgi:hypothetical protein